MKEKYLCADCANDTRKDRSDFFMVKDFLWEEYGVGERMLCLKCFEERLGRKLHVSDLLKCFVNEKVNPYTFNLIIQESLNVDEGNN